MRMISLVIMLLLLQTVQSGEPTRPNILFLFADDQRADTIAALGNRHIKTPNLDRLVQRGISFDQAYMQGGMHGATCIPSRAMLLSGRSLFHIDERLKQHPTWPYAFGQAGYTTFITGKWHNNADSIPFSFQQARSIFAGGMTNPLQAKLIHLEQGKMTAPQLAPKHACEVFADEAIRFISQHQGSPFLCYVPFDAPHDPHIVPDDFPVHYDPASLPVPANFLPQHPFDNGEMVVRDEKLLPWPRTPQQIREMLAEYYRYVSHLDAQVGRILDALEKSPHASNTIVVFAADSGVARGSHGLIGKQNLYEHSIRVPLIITGPGIATGQQTQAMCYLFDVFPTLGELCRVKAPFTSQGISLLSVLRDPRQSARSELLFAYRQYQRAIRQGQWKLIRYPKVNIIQLFNLQTDSDEKHNLSLQPEQAVRVAGMSAQLARLQKAFDDKEPLQVEKPLPAAWSPLVPGNANRK
ncbi:MAG: sulfatase-like hydrolase/transferase [Planctomycetia bacterium]|nr:sulfatase-like hydrolase/transferase [Planctomycetia bacterium]